MILGLCPALAHNTAFQLNTKGKDILLQSLKDFGEQFNNIKNILYL